MKVIGGPHRQIINSMNTISGGGGCVIREVYRDLKGSIILKMYRSVLTDNNLT